MQQLQQCKVTPGTERRIFLWHFDENVTSVCVTVRHGGEAVVAHLWRTSAAFHKLLTLNTSWFRANILSAVKVCKKKKKELCFVSSAMWVAFKLFVEMNTYVKALQGIFHASAAQTCNCEKNGVNFQKV